MPPVSVLATAAQGPQGPSFRLRCSALAESVEPYGVELRSSPLFTEREAREFGSAGLLRRAGIVHSARTRLLSGYRQGAFDAESVVVQRQADFLPALDLERKISSGRRIVYDVDDAIWLDRSGAGGHPLAFLKRTEAKVRWLATRAAHVVAGNELLAEHLSQFNASVSVIPTLIDVSEPAAPAPLEADAIVLGWTGSPSTAPYLDRIRPALERFAASIAPTPVRLLVVGGAAPELAGIEVEPIRWSESAEREALARMQIGLMPLPDTPWNRGKCAFKALRYMGAGVPVVADDVGVTATTVGPGGIVLREADRWADALGELARSPADRIAMGEDGRRHVIANFSTSRWAPELARIWAGR